jgi:crossover junction endodeoxyribonuclease RuvC
MISVGLDISTKTGMARVGGLEDLTTLIHLPKERGMTRVHSIAHEVAETLAVWAPEIIVIEGYAYCKNIASFVVLVEIGTAIRLALKGLGLSWVEVGPTVLKRWVTGKGNASKDEMAWAVKHRWNFVHSSNDIVDAFALAQMGQLGLAELVTLPSVFCERH